MKWFFKWVRHGMNTLEKEDRAYEANAIGFPTVAKQARVKSARLTSPGNEGISLNQSPMNFRIYPATGGHIVEYTFYNEKTDRSDQALHLIPSELDLGSELAKIMTLEALKR